MDPWILVPPVTWLSDTNLDVAAYSQLWSLSVYMDAVDMSTRWSSLLELCSLKGVIGDFHRDETDHFQCLHLQWRTETPLRVDPSPVSSTMEGSVHQPAVSQLYNTPHSLSLSYLGWALALYLLLSLGPSPLYRGQLHPKVLTIHGLAPRCRRRGEGVSPSAVAPICVCRGIHAASQLEQTTGSIWRRLLQSASICPLFSMSCAAWGGAGSVGRAQQEVPSDASVASLLASAAATTQTDQFDPLLSTFWANPSWRLDWNAGGTKNKPSTAAEN